MLLHCAVCTYVYINLPSCGNILNYESICEILESTRFTLATWCHCKAGNYITRICIGPLVLDIHISITSVLYNICYCYFKEEFTEFSVLYMSLQSQQQIIVDSNEIQNSKKSHATHFLLCIYVLVNKQHTCR